MLELDDEIALFYDMKKAPKDKLFRAFCFQQAGCDIRKYRFFIAGYIGNKLYLQNRSIDYSIKNELLPTDTYGFTWCRDYGWYPLGWQHWQK